MAGTMRIRLSPELPAMVVEVLSPGLDPVKQLLISPDSEARVDVPSESSFIRVRMPSGRSVTLSHPGNLDYVVTPQDLQRRRPADPAATIPMLPDPVLPDPVLPDPGNLRQIKGAHFADSQTKRAVKRAGGAFQGSGLPLDAWRVMSRSRTEPYTGQTLSTGLRIEWQPAVLGEVSLDGRNISFSPLPAEHPREVHLRTSGSARLAIRLPGNVDDAHIRLSRFGKNEFVSVAISTLSELGDTLGSYVARRDYYSAEAMTPWASSAENMLRAKQADPWTATIGAYLLFRLGRYDLMHDWAKNLADWFGTIPDGCVLWAMQSIQEKKDGASAKEYLLEAVRRGLPIYTEGLRLLSEGLRRIGPGGARALQALTEQTGRVLWTSPFTTVFDDDFGGGGPETTFEISYVAPA